MAETDGMVAGLYHAQLAFRDSNGYPMGQLTAPDTQTPGTTTSAYKINAPVSIEHLTISRSRAVRQGGMQVISTRMLGVNDFAAFNMTLSGVDEVFDAFIKSYTHDTSTASGLDISAPNAGLIDPPQFMLGLTVGFQTAAGDNQFQTTWYHNVQIVREGDGPAAAQDDGTNPNPLTYQITVSKAPRTVLGMLFSATSLAVDDDSDVSITIRHNNPIAITTYIDDAAATTFVSGFRPVGSDVDGSNNVWTTNGVDTNANVSAFSVTTGATTHTAASSGDIWVVAYPTDFVAI